MPICTVSNAPKARVILVEFRHIVWFAKQLEVLIVKKFHGLSVLTQITSVTDGIAAVSAECR